MSKRRPPVALFALAVLLGTAAVLARDGPAQSRSIVDRFPTPAQVRKDFGDDASRRVALQILYQTLQEKTPPPRSQVASERITAYFLAFGEIDYTYTRQAANSPARRNYNTRVRLLLADPTFKNAVLSRYGLAGLSPEGASRARIIPRTVPRDAVDPYQQAFARAAPYWLGTLAVLIGLPSMFLMLRPSSLLSMAARSRGAGGPDVLPDSLRAVTVLGRRYDLELETGVVIEATADRLWVRTPSGHENAWRFGGWNLPVRGGHIVSRVGRRLRESSDQTALMYNHTTLSYEGINEIDVLFEARGSRLPWLATAAAGTLGFVWAVAATSWYLGPVEGRVEWTGVWWMGAIISAIIAAISTAATRRLFVRSARKRFRTRYVPDIAAFLNKTTPALKTLLG
jgi:hypothetical protein